MSVASRILFVLVPPLLIIAHAATAPITSELRASGSPNYFRDARGNIIVLAGSHTWNTVQDWGTEKATSPLDFNAYVDFLLRHGNNFTLLWTVELPSTCGLPTVEGSTPEITVSPFPWKRTGPGKATDGGLKFDLGQFDNDYFNRLRMRTDMLRKAGIYAGVYLFTGEWLNVFRCQHDGYPLTGPNNVNHIDDGYTGGKRGLGSMTMTAPNDMTRVQDAYVEKAIDTLNDLPNVLWIISEEAPASTAWWNHHQIMHIRSYESKKTHQHPIGFGSLIDGSDQKIYNSDADWVAPSAKLSPNTSCGTGRPTCKVNVNDSDHSYFGMWNESPQQNRNYVWENLLNGNQVLFMDPYLVYYPRQTRNLCLSPVHGICREVDARWNNVRDNAGFILRYAHRLNLANVSPQPSLSSTGYCLAQVPSTGAEYLIYAPVGGTFSVDLSAMPPSRMLAIEWFNPTTGAVIAQAPIKAGATSQSFTAPFDGDAVLYLVDAAGHAGQKIMRSTK